jgi:hypothetical protein
MGGWGAGIGIAASSIVVIGGLFGLLRIVISHEIRTVKDEFKPNSKSFRDHVDRRLDSQDSKLWELGERVATIEGAVGRPTLKRH